MEFITMKRGGELIDESSNSGKRIRVSEKFRLRLLVPSKQAGAIIGKGGNRIKLLRSDNNANVRIADCPGPERIMIIQSEESATTIKVVEQALTYMSEESNGPLEIRLVLHDSLIGAVLGKKGNRIQEVRSQTGCTVVVYQTCCPQSTERIVSIQGSEDKILLALEMVLEAIKGNSIRGEDILYDPINFDATFADKYGGYGNQSDLRSLPIAPKLVQTTPMSRSGGSFRKEPKYFQGSGAPSQLNPFQFGGMGIGSISKLGSQGNLTFGNNAGFPGIATGILNEGLESYNSILKNNPVQAISGPTSDTLELTGADTQTSIPTETKVTIPNSVVGAIIGHGGSRIRDIRITSKAQIKIEEPDESTGERIITIAGDLKQIQLAQYLLQQAVRENAIRR